jgi:hypothetical protein
MAPSDTYATEEAIGRRLKASSPVLKPVEPASFRPDSEVIRHGF